MNYKEIKDKKYPNFFNIIFEQLFNYKYLYTENIEYSMNKFYFEINEKEVKFSSMHLGEDSFYPIEHDIKFELNLLAEEILNIENSFTQEEKKLRFSDVVNYTKENEKYKMLLCYTPNYPQGYTIIGRLNTKDKVDIDLNLLSEKSLLNYNLENKLPQKKSLIKYKKI